MTNNQSTWSTLSDRAAFNTEKGAGDLGEIVVFIDGRTETLGMLEFAGVLAEEHGARLISVFLQPEPPITNAQMFARGTGMGKVTDLHREEVKVFETRHRVMFEDTVRRHGLASEWRSLPSLNAAVGVHMYPADLVVVARPASVERPAGPPDLAQSLILSSGRPVIVFPPQCTVAKVRRVLVGWNARRESIRAVADALPLLIRAEAVEVLTLDDQDDARSQGPESGTGIASHLARHGAPVEVRSLPKRGQDVGRLLLVEAAGFRADLLVMGAYGHSQLHEWMFGGVTRGVLYEADLPVLMSR